MNNIEQFAHIFAGRTDAYGAEHGECIRQPVTLETYRHHLEGAEPIGIYPIVNNQTTWGCVDIDIHAPGKKAYDYETQPEAINAAFNLVTALKTAGITAWVEITRSGGTHTWCWADQPVSAQTMRRALLVASQIAGTPVREVNPKSEQYGPNDLGNYVRLPYPEGARWRHMITRAGTNIPLKHWLAMWKPDPASRYQTVAELWVPPAPIRRAATQPIERTGNGLLDKMMAEGPLDGMDRSTFLFKIGIACAKAALTVDSTLMTIRAADEQWCQKYSGRPDADRRYMDIVNRTLGATV